MNDAWFGTCSTTRLHSSKSCFMSLLFQCLCMIDIATLVVYVIHEICAKHVCSSSIQFRCRTNGSGDAPHLDDGFCINPVLDRREEQYVVIAEVMSPRPPPWAPENPRARIPRPGLFPSSFWMVAIVVDNNFASIFLLLICIFVLTRITIFKMDVRAAGMAAKQTVAI